MRDIKVIIGANAGDEGKGLATDYFASQHDHGVVVMTNGGSQRAHTVELPDGTRHVFQHFGSGTFRGWDTCYSAQFILNPMQFCCEYAQIFPKKYAIKSAFDRPISVYADKRCRWSTPYDMIFNQIEQRLSGVKNTCGMGIWTTIQRYKDFEDNGINNIELSPYTSIEEYKEYVLRVRKYYDQKLIKLIKDDGIMSLISDLYMCMFDFALLDHFLADLKKTIDILIFDIDPFMKYDNIIFENGQGLMIDQDADIVYGTPSYTGLTIPKRIINDNFHSVNVEVCYVTRSYLTRHGYGELTEEVNKGIINPYMVDQTNHENEFQGSLRFGKLYPNDLMKRINNDWMNNITLNPFVDFNIYTKSLMVTHLNEHSFSVSEVENNFANVYLSDTKYSKDIRKYKVDTVE